MAARGWAHCWDRTRCSAERPATATRPGHQRAAVPGCTWRPAPGPCSAWRCALPGAPSAGSWRAACCDWKRGLPRSAPRASAWLASWPRGLFRWITGSLETGVWQVPWPMSQSGVVALSKQCGIFQSAKLGSLERSVAALLSTDRGQLLPAGLEGPLALVVSLRMARLLGTTTGRPARARRVLGTTPPQKSSGFVRHPDSRMPALLERPVAFPDPDPAIW
mmetsp:Transcript_57434/g.163089  ORF Transcript_57434/g.163089 Transcript_57434/m.163089 type:complete len:220 (+) Transcript_57434:335-994(+)